MMISDKWSVVVEAHISNHFLNNPEDKVENVTKYFFNSLEIQKNKETFNHEIFEK